MSGYFKTFKVKDGDKDKNSKLMSFCIDDEKLLEKYKSTWTKIEDLKDIKLNALPVYDDRYMKTKIRTYSDKVILTFVAFFYIHLFLLILYLHKKTNIACKYI